MEADETSRQVKKNMTQFGHYFVPELQRHDANTVASRGRILKYNGHWLQVFCASKRRIILSRDYFLAKDEPLNRDVLCADINYNFLIVSLRRPTTGVISTKFISLNNNQDLGEIVEDSTFTKVIEVDDLPKTTAVDVRLVVINNRNQVIMIAFKNGQVTEMKNLFAIDSQYPMIANVKNHLVFINQDHTLRYDLVANKVNKLVNNDKHRHLCFFKTPEGDELELLEINKFLYIKTKTGNVIAYQEPIDIGVTNGALAMSNLHEYATGLDLKVLIVAFLVANYYSVVVLDWQTQAFLCEFKVVIGSDVKAADFYFENIFADSSDIRYIKGTMIENEKVVYDLTLVQLSSVKTRQSDDFQDTFLDLFKKQDIPISNQVIQRFQVFDVTAPEPRTLAQFHNNFQIPLVDRLIKEGRVSLIENALKFKKGRLHSIGTELAFKNTHHFVSTVVLPLITNKEEELRQFIHNHFKQAASTAEELNQLKDQRLENHLITYIAYLTDLDRVRAANRRSS